MAKNTLSTLLLKPDSAMTYEELFDSDEEYLKSHIVEEDEVPDVFHLPKNVPDDTFLIVAPAYNPDAMIDLSKNKTTNRELPDLNRVVIATNFCCRNQSDPRILPAIVSEVFDCAYCSAFFESDIKLPLTEVMDCSYAIKDLVQLINKLPTTLTTLVVQEQLIKPSALRNNPERLDSARIFLVAYPEIRVIDANNKYDLRTSIEQIDQEIAASKTKTEKNTDKKANEPQPEKNIEIKDPIKDIDFNDIMELCIKDTDIAQYELNRDTLRRCIQWVLNHKFKDSKKLKQHNINSNTPVICVVKDIFPEIKRYVLEYISQYIHNDDDKDSDKTSEQPKPSSPETPEQNEEPALQSNDFDTSLQIKKYIKNTDLEQLDNQPEEKRKLIQRLEHFNVWNQPVVNGHTCVYIDDKSQVKLLNHMKCKNKKTFSYGNIRANGKYRFDFKSTRLMDADGNTIKDDNGQEVVIMVCIDFVADHGKGTDHTDNIRNIDIYVTPQTLSATQKNNIRAKKSNKTIVFFSLTELDDAKTYTRFIYEPKTSTNTQSSEKDKTTLLSPSISTETVSGNPDVQTKKMSSVTIAPETPHRATLEQWAFMYEKCDIDRDFMLLTFETLIHKNTTSDGKQTVAEAFGYKKETVSSKTFYTIAKPTAFGEWVKQIRKNVYVNNTYVDLQYKTVIRIVCDDILTNDKTKDTACLYFYKSGSSYFFKKRSVQEFIDNYVWSLEKLAAKIGKTPQELVNITENVRYTDYKTLTTYKKIHLEWFMIQPDTTTFNALRFEEFKQWIDHKDDKTHKNEQSSVQPIPVKTVTLSKKTMLEVKATETYLAGLVNLCTQSKSMYEQALTERQNVQKALASETDDAKINLLVAQISGANKKVQQYRERFERAQYLINSYNNAEKDKTAAQKVLQEKERALKSIESQIDAFLANVK